MSDSHPCPSSSTPQTTPLLPPAEYARSRHGVWLSAAGLMTGELGRILPLQPSYRDDGRWLLPGWMNRLAVLATADRFTVPEVAVAVMGDGSLWTHKAEWTTALKALIQYHLGSQRRAGSGTYTEPRRRFEDDFAASAFSTVTTHRIHLSRSWKPEDVIGYLRTTSFTRPDLFAHTHARFETEARHLLSEDATSGTLHEETAFTVLLARRPGGGA